ncbi:CopG family transcriptional regulator [Candidatus Competibacter phosphatis]|uniref:CopG family transcriptional regulator n=1 Tax=Candidatus Competibacter phosphatis TaxID=221280 RepID=A0ABX1TNT9_9GAMM|nr:ribbon-helix-helix protein, CopG family [Candidatus Competibacter phosphatis]NMQ21103.1 CopG family transcriptional regulator [Candidatus Competibacter phosphatis]
MRTVSIRLDEATDARLRQIRARTGQSQTEVIKAAIAAFAEREEPAPAQSAAALDLIGCFDSGVGDLGRNHARHLRAQLAAKHRRVQAAD